jgi:hypothetical protein
VKRFWQWLLKLFGFGPKPPVVVPPPPPPPPPTPKCVFPPDDGKWEPVEAGVATTIPLLMSAEAHVNKQGTPDMTLEALAAFLVQVGSCAGKQGDSLMIKRGDGDWDEYHAVAYTDGGYTLKPFRGVWHYAG